MVEESVHFRLADWNRHSRRETDACRADYFAIEHGKKFRVDIVSDVSQRPISANFQPFNQPDVAVSGPDRFTVMIVVAGGLVCSAIVLLGVILLYVRQPVIENPLVPPSESVEKGCPEKLKFSDESRDTADNSEDGSHCSSDLQSNDPPQDQAHEGLENLSDRQSDSITLATPSSVSFNVEEVKQRALEMTAALDVAQTCLKEAGHTVEVKHLIPWIVQHQISTIQRADTMQQEARRLLFEASQNELTREHQATLAREDSKWLERIRKACDDLVSEVEHSCIKVFVVEFCGQTAYWYHKMFQGSATFESLIMQVCHFCTFDAGITL
jgi:hypothetical protein